MDLQHEERLSKVEERSKSNSHRIDDLEKKQDKFDEIVTSINVLVQNPTADGSEKSVPTAA